jgi:hypothetical protein
MDENKNEENVEQTTENKDIETKDSKKEGSWFKNTWNTIYNKLGLKKLLIISYIALGVIVVALIISVSVVGAKNGKLKNQSATTSFSKKEEASFTTWKKAAIASLNYEGELTLTETDDDKDYYEDIINSNTVNTYQEMIYPDGQYAFSKNYKYEYYVDGKIDSTDEDTYYDVIKNDNGTYKFTNKSYEDAKAYQIVDNKYYKDISLSIDFSSFEEVLICASASSLSELENVAKCSAFYLGEPIYDFECSIESNKGVTSLNVKYTVTNTASSFFDDDYYDITISVSNGYISQILKNETLIRDEIDDSEKDYKLVKTKVCDYVYHSDITFLDSIIDGKNDFSGTANKNHNSDVSYYLEGGLLKTVYNYEIGDPFTPYFDSGYTWYIDEACTTPYTNQAKTSGVTKLYGKLNEQTDGKAHLIILKNKHFVYPENYADLLKEEDYASATINALDISDTTAAANSILGMFGDYTGKITMDGKEYTIEELSKYTFEANKIYTLSYDYNVNPFYS